MKERELRQHASCNLCGRKIGESGLPLFWVVSIERHGIKADVVRRQTGLAMMMGSAALAQAMGPDEDMTMPIMEPVRITVCEPCSTKTTCVGMLAERGSNAEGVER